MTESDQVTYYSSWIYSAVHIALVIPRLQNIGALAEYLGLSAHAVKNTVEELSRMGLIEEVNGKYIGKYDRLHLASNSPLTSRNHTNWRLKAIQSLESATRDDLHYSFVTSISASAAEKIREALLETIQALEPIVKEAKAETLYALSLDFFGMGRS